ncbi:distal tail protein Dit [Lactococcus formosensis]|uniref:distal tail protein Dit n=1 Tax=Lactococcus formosensis TaxID=1281486 RepID=UPI0039F6DD1E
MNLEGYPYFQFRGRKSTELNMRLLNEMEFVIPETSIELQEIAGRNSSMIIDKNNFKDIEKRFPVRLYLEEGYTIPEQLREITAWLYSQRTYTPLVFSEYGNYYYKALAYGSISAKDKKREWLDIDISFKCQPFMYRLDGNEEIQVITGQSLYNPEAYTSQPLLKFNKTSASSDSNFYIAGKQFRIAKEAGVGEITIDSERGIAYKAGNQNISSLVLLNSGQYTPPQLLPGENTFTFSGDINNFRVVPRWRALAL